MILENVNPSFLAEFREKIEVQIKEYEKEINHILTEQIGTTGDAVKRLNVFKLDMFSRKIVQDKYSLEKLRDFIYFLENCHKEEKRQVQTVS